MDPTKYLDQFRILKSDVIKCQNLSQMLYQAILNKFKVTYNDEEYEIFSEYQHRTFDLIEDLREKDLNTISLILTHVNSIDPYLADNIIMCWCLPRVGVFFSKKAYSNAYKENISSYNHLLISLIDHIVIKNFCIETITKTNYVPVHTIDLLWGYFEDIELEFEFYNKESGEYIGFDLSHSDSTIKFGFNMEHMLWLGLGKVVRSNNKGSFRNFIKILLIDDVLMKKLYSLPTGENYRNQVKTILLNKEEYFGKLLN